MESIEELEQAIDAMDGIDTDGGEIDTSDVREARVRSAYLDWCKEYGKTADESRFPTFSSNFLAMEEYAKENGREMVLNKYADCTEEEYRELTQGKICCERMYVGDIRENPLLYVNLTLYDLIPLVSFSSSTCDQGNKTRTRTSGREEARTKGRGKES